MKNILFLATFTLFAASNLAAQIDETGASYWSIDYSSDTDNEWVQYRNNTGQTVNLQIQVIANNGYGQNASWMALEGEPGVPTANNIASGVTFWLQTASYPIGFNTITHWRSIIGYSVVAVNHAPTISWSATPGTVASGQSYTISAHGHDQDGNLTQVNVWKNGQPFAFAGGGNGTDGDSGNPTSDTGPTTVTFTAQAVDSNGATSATISQTVTVAAPNQPPTIAWTGTPGSVASGQGYTISAHGHDNNGNLTAVSIWKNGQPFAFAGGGNGTDGDSSNPTSDTGPQTVTFTAQAFDSASASSAIISQTVTVAAPNHPPTISWNTTPATVASGQSYTVSARGHDQDGNLTQVNVWKNGVPFAFAGGGNGTDGDSGNTTTDTGPQTVTFTAQAVDANGATSATISQTVTIAAPNHAPTIAWNTTPGTVASGQSYTVSARGHDQDGNLTQVTVWKNGVPFAVAGGGNGTDSDSGNTTSDTGPKTVTFTAQAVDANSATSATISQTVTIAAPNHAPTIAWNTTPGTVASGQSYTVSAHGHDQDGNLTQVTVWKNGVPFAVAGSGNGTDGDSSNTTSDIGPQTVTFTAQAVDSNGATSATISQTVTVNAPPVNHAPTISWNTTPGTVASGQSYTVSAHGHDQDGNLTQVNVWKNSQPFAVGGGGNGTDADSGSSTSDTGPQTITFTAQAVDSKGAASATISQTVTIAAPNHPPTIAWNTTPGTVASSQSYTVSAHGHDQDGNLTQVNVWKNGVPFAFAGGGNGTDADSGSSTSDTGPQTVTFTAQAVDANGATSATISQTVTVTAPPPAQYTLSTTAGTGGGVSPGGTFVAGSVVTVAATPDAMHDFAGWSGDATGAANPVSVTLDRNKSVQANFTLKNFALATSATAGGSVTPGGTYPAGTTVTISASPDAAHRFSGWSGDASGTASPVAITLDRAKSVQAIFTGKTSQAIAFNPPGDHANDSTPFALSATASSGLSVTFAVVSGPATVSNGVVQVTGPGTVVIQASQPGDGFYLPAAPVTQSFNVIAAVVLKYHGSARALLQTTHTTNGAPFVIQVP
jgi:alkylhydroperoxidase/carboxymuconolactone decarboxylase family protein YurZ